MAPSKRKASNAIHESAPESKRSRPKKEVEKTASSSRPNRKSLIAAKQPRSLRSSVSSAASPPELEGRNPAKKTSVTKTKVNGHKKEVTRARVNGNDDIRQHQANVSVEIDSKTPTAADDADEEDEEGDGPAYWLMKAEPNSRVEKGKDVKFSIDDLKAATSPEAWDGVRNAVARNNMRAMMKGDQAFFYHSNCKIPGIVGIMSVVQEHSVDETAFDPEHPYFDEKSIRDKPKWCVVHVEFRNKFAEMVKLKELQKYAKDGGVLQNMQMLKQSRLSVSKVSKKEWDFIMTLVEMEETQDAEASKQHEPQMVA